MISTQVFDRAKEYARHLASTGLCVGLIEIDASEFRVMCFDSQARGYVTAWAPVTVKLLS